MQSTTPQTVPDSWPGAFGLFGYSKKVVTANLGVFFAYLSMYAIYTLAVTALNRSSSSMTSSHLVALLLGLFVGSAFTALGTVICLSAAKGRKVVFSQAFSRAVQVYPRFLGVTCLLYLAIFAGIILLIIPALVLVFFFLPRLALTYYFIADEDKNASTFGAISDSWKATEHNVVKIWGLIGVTLLYSLLFITIIGIPVALYLLFMYNAAFALLYLYLTRPVPGRMMAPVPPAPMVPPQAPQL